MAYLNQRPHSLCFRVEWKCSHINWDDVCMQVNTKKDWPDSSSCFHLSLSSGLFITPLLAASLGLCSCLRLALYFSQTREEDGLPSSTVLWLAQTALSTAPDSLLDSSLSDTPGLHTLLYLDSRLPRHQETRFTQAPDFIWALWCTMSWQWGLFSLFLGNLSHNVPAWRSGWLW